MKSPDWAIKDYQDGLYYILGHEEEVEKSPLLDTGKGLFISVPRGLPACRIHFMGWFMLAPIVVFMLTVLIFPFLGFSTRWEFEMVPIGITFGCVLLFTGLIWAMKMMLKSRELFPRHYFVTLGSHGIAMYFPRLHFLGQNPKTALAWENVESVNRTVIRFIPALLTGKLHVPALRINGANKDSAIIPFSPTPDVEKNIEQIESVINERMK